MAKSKDERKKGSTASYPLQIKMEALKVLQLNNYNFYKTAKQVGISHMTLHRWNDKLGSTMSDADKTTNLARSISEHAVDRNEGLLDVIFQAKELILSRIMVLTKKEKNLDNLQKTFKTLSVVDGTLTVSPAGDVDKKEGITVYEQINNILIQQDYEPKTPIIIDGDQA